MGGMNYPGSRYHSTQLSRRRMRRFQRCLILWARFGLNRLTCVKAPYFELLTTASDCNSTSWSGSSVIPEEKKKPDSVLIGWAKLPVMTKSSVHNAPETHRSGHRGTGAPGDCDLGLCQVSTAAVSQEFGGAILSVLRRIFLSGKPLNMAGFWLFSLPSNKGTPLILLSNLNLIFPALPWSKHKEYPTAAGFQAVCFLLATSTLAKRLLDLNHYFFVRVCELAEISGGWKD